MPFDLSVSFDKTDYLTPQTYLMVDTLRGNLPDDTVLHVLTNRPRNDPLIEHIVDAVPTKLYHRESFTNLKSRCQFMFHCFEVETDKPWLIKIESDMLFLKHLSAYEKMLDYTYDVIIEPENRKIFPDDAALAVWNTIYGAMGMPTPTFKIQYRENGEWGLPLFGTGMVAVKSQHLRTINRRWIPLTKICEKWINYNVHPNEQAMTALILDEGWKWKLYPAKYKFNPIGHFRKGIFPSTELVDDCILPDDVVCLDWHHWSWLKKIGSANQQVQEIIDRNRHRIPDEMWNLDVMGNATLYKQEGR